MSRFLFYILLLVAAIVSNGQRQFKMPKGLEKKQVSKEWIIVKLRDEAASTSLKTKVKKLQALRKSSTKKSILDGMYKVPLAQGEDPIEVINELLKNPNVIYAEPLVNYQPLSYAPSDPSNSSSQSYLERIQAYEAWGVTKGDDDIAVGIVDTGIDLDHQDLSNSIWINENDPIDGEDNDGNGYIDDYYGYDFADYDNNPDADGNTHGSQVGGIAGADTDNSIGMSGVGFNTKVAALKGFTTVGTVSNNLYEAITYAADNGIEVLNLSFGALRDGLQSEQDIINYATLEKDVVVVAAAGNTNIDGKFHPASYNHVLSVSGTNVDDTKWSSSTYNYAVDIVAPSSGIYSTTANDGYTSESGTSFGAPMVAGVAALVRAVFPELDALQVMERVRVTADDIYDVGSNSDYEGKLGLGRLNAYKAVAQTGVKSLRITDYEAATSISNLIFAGDTVTVSAAITNYLDYLEDPQLSIAAANENITLAISQLYPGALNTLDEDSISFSFVVDNDLAPETPLDIRIDIQDETYSDFQFIELETAPDYVDFGTDITMTVAGNGNLGFAEANYSDGIGLLRNNTSILSHAGLMIATDSNNVADNFVSNYSSFSREQDFESLNYIKLSHHPAADLFGYSEFENPTNHIVVEQSMYAWDNEEFIILRYRIINNSDNDIHDLRVGFYSDFDLLDHLSNKAEHDISGGYLYTYDNTNSLFAGTQVISGGADRYAALDLNSENGNIADIENAFPDESKLGYLEQLLETAGDEGNGNDVALLNGSAFENVLAGDSKYLTVIVAASNSKADLETAFASASNKLDLIAQNPRVLEETFSCEGNAITLDPESGTNFLFYEDPEGTQLIAESTSISTGVINQDTSFYVVNIDKSYPSELFQIRVSLLDEVADFEMSPDTLYLDNEVNIVSFADQSYQANVWNWDFGQGTTSIIQNPVIALSETGEYAVSLYVENDLGCTDTKIQTLVVANRSATPVFDEFSTCPNDSILLYDPAADYFKVYRNEDDVNYLQKGNNIKVGPFHKDTTIYVRGVYDGLESLPAAITINVDEVANDFTLQIDTLSEENQLIAVTNVNDSFEWFINGISTGSASSISIDAATIEPEVSLVVENENGCIVRNDQYFEFSSSPIPSQSDVSFCGTTPPTIRPENGTVFGFYLDEMLETLIKKGTELTIGDETKIFIAGLDDGLPGTPIEVNIEPSSVEITIDQETTEIDNKNRVELSILGQETINDYRWFIDGQLTETASSPIFFFNDNDIYEVAVDINTTTGCLLSDTLLLDFRTSPETLLSTENQNAINIYPNPASEWTSITGLHPTDRLSLWDVSGKIKIADITITDSQQLDLRSIGTGVYTLKIYRKDEEINRKLIVR